MDSAISKKIRIKKGKEPSDLLKQVASELVNIENATTDDFKSVLTNFQVCGAKEIEGGKGGKKVLIVVVPHSFRLLVKNIHQRLVRELEKKFSEKHVVIVLERKIVSEKMSALSGKPRKRSQTVAKVHEELLDDVLFPTEIVGKRTKVSGGKKLVRIYLSSNDQINVQPKLPSFEAAYKALTKKDVKLQY